MAPKNNASNNKYRYLVSNIGALTISSFATKILSFFLVPLYTSILTTAEYGTYDLISTTVGLLLPILTLNMTDSVLRFTIDEKYDKKISFTFCLKVCLIGTLILALFCVLNAIFNFVPLFAGYEWFLFADFVLSFFGSLVSNFAKGMEKVRAIAVGGIVGSVVTIGLNLLLLLYFKLGFLGYMIATLVGPFCQVVYLFVRIQVWKYFSWQKTSKVLKREMLLFSLPMILNSLSWWINGASDRYVITAMCGINANGIYSVASKIPTILVMIATIFGQAWSISAFKEFDVEDKNFFFRNVYNLYQYIMVAACSLLIVLNKTLASFLYSGDFYAAWQYVPFLLISVVFEALAGYFSGVFDTLKKTKVLAYTTFISAAINTVLNIVLIYFIGVIGAAVATMVCFFVMWLMRLIKTLQLMRLKLSLVRDSLCYVILVGQALLVLYSPLDDWINILIGAFCFLIINCCFSPEIKRIFIKIKGFLRDSKNKGVSGNE